MGEALRTFAGTVSRSTSSSLCFSSTCRSNAATRSRSCASFIGAVGPGGRNAHGVRQARERTGRSMAVSRRPDGGQ